MTSDHTLPADARARNPIGYSTPRLERLRAGLPEHPPAGPPRTRRDELRDFLIGVAHVEAVAIAHVARFARSWDAWLNQPVAR